MTTPMSAPRPEEEVLQLAFAPLHKRNFGLAIGLAAGLFMFAMTLVFVIRDGAQFFNLGLLRNYFAGYTATLPGAFVGLAWGIGVGFVAGWFIAFLRNMVLAISVFLIRTRAELFETRDFLDHI